MRSSLMVADASPLFVVFALHLMTSSPATTKPNTPPPSPHCKVDPDGCDDKVLRERVLSAEEEARARARSRKAASAAAHNFGISCNIMGRHSQRAKVRMQRQEIASEQVAQTKFRHKKQQLARKKFAEHNDAVEQLRRQVREARYDAAASVPRLELLSEEKVMRKSRAAELAANFMRRGQGGGSGGGLLEPPSSSSSRSSRSSSSSSTSTSSTITSTSHQPHSSLSVAYKSPTAAVAAASAAASASSSAAAPSAAAAGGQPLVLQKRKTDPRPEDRKAALHQLAATEAAELPASDAASAQAALSNLRRFMPLPKSVTAYRSFGALGPPVVPPFGTGSLPRDSAHQVRQFDIVVGER